MIRVEKENGAYDWIRTNTVEILSFLTPAVGLHRRNFNERAQSTRDYGPCQGGKFGSP